MEMETPKVILLLTISLSIVEISTLLLKGFYIITVELEHDVGIFNMNYQQRISVSGS